jgi:hypothetical protein
VNKTTVFSDDSNAFSDNSHAIVKPSVRDSKDIGYRQLADYESKQQKHSQSLRTDSGPSGSSGLTLLRLKAWMQEPTER